MVTWNVMTARELVIWSVKNPTALQEWAKSVWEEERGKKEIAVEKARLKKAATKKAAESLRKSNRVGVPNLENRSIKSKDVQENKVSHKSKRTRGDDSDSICGEAKDVRDEGGVRGYKRSKTTPKANDTDEFRDEGLFGEVSFTNLALRPASIQKGPAQPSSTPNAMEGAF